jgi:uncharacterized coiled-coil DUF342 family protein
MQKAVATLQEEVRQLKGTADALRQQLDQQRYEYQEARSKLEARNQGEREELQKTIAALRERLEARNG